MQLVANQIADPQPGPHGQSISLGSNLTLFMRVKARSYDIYMILSTRSSYYCDNLYLSVCAEFMSALLMHM